MIKEKVILGQIDIGIQPDLDYLSGVHIHLTRLDREGYPHTPGKTYKGDVHGSQVAAVMCGPYYDDDLLPFRAIEAIDIPRMGKTILCLLRALDAMLASDIRVLCLPIGINLPTPVFRPFTKALAERGVLVVVPAGNKEVGTVLTPGTYPEVLTVGALYDDGQVAGSSGRKQEDTRKPEIFAQGAFPDPAASDPEKVIRGTSMACAYIAGRAARILEKDPGLTLPELRVELGAGAMMKRPYQFSSDQPYIDRRLKTLLNSCPEDQEVEGIIVAGPQEGTGAGNLSADRLLKETEEQAGCAPGEVGTFRRKEVIHLVAARRFYDVLLDHPGLHCAQAVDVSVFDL